MSSSKKTDLTTSAPGIILENISLSFAQQTLFSNLSCEFTANQFTCILGPSGVGKSSLLRLIADLYPMRIAYMAQTDSLLPWLNTEENALFGARLRGKISTDKKNQARELLKRVGLKNTEQNIDELSGGMRQRVALVRTLLEDKPIVLMDEPFAALDVITRLNLQDLAAELLKNKTVILVTHDPLEALRLGHTIYVLSGTPAQLGTPIIPVGTIPRATTNADILQLQGELLTRLQHAQELM
jgi:putative hydroxymethylpyrimidine transport system ATP-binding protein